MVQRIEYGLQRGGETEIRGQKTAGSRQTAEVGGQRSEDKRISCGSGFPRPELVEGQPRSYDLNDFNGLNDLLLTVYCLPNSPRLALYPI